jgi:hypothetical protein
MLDSSFLIYLYILLLLLGAAFIAGFLFFWNKHRQLLNFIIPRARNSIFLEIQVPKENADKEEKPRTQDEKKQLIAVAEQIFTTLSEVGSHGFFGYKDYIAFEIVAIKKKISFYINCTKDLADLIEKQIHAQYPTAQIEEVRPYNPFLEKSRQSAAELILQKNYVYHFRTYKNMESDPLNAITNAMSKLDENESCVVQLVLSPAGIGWMQRPRRMALEIQQGKNPELVERSVLGRFIHEFIRLGNAPAQMHKHKDLSGFTSPIQLTPMQQEIVKRLEEKASRPGFKSNIRIITSAPTLFAADAHIRSDPPRPWE